LRQAIGIERPWAIKQTTTASFDLVAFMAQRPFMRLLAAKDKPDSGQPRYRKTG